MASKHSIAVAQFQKNFSRYFQIGTKSECKWKYNESFSEDDDLLGFQAEIQMINPLSGSNNDESLNNDCSSPVTNSITNTLFLPQTETSDQIQLSFDCQKEDEHSTGFDKNRNEIVQDTGGPMNSTQELMNVLEANATQNQLKPTDGTQDLCCLVDYWNKSADVTEGEAEADGTIESLIRALTKFENSNEEFGSVRSNEEFSAVVADAGKPIILENERIDLIGDGNEKIEKSTDDANGTVQELLTPFQYTEECTGFSHQQVGGNIQQIGNNIQQVDGNIQRVFDNGQQSDGNFYQVLGDNGQQVGSNEQQVGDNERQASSINEEINQYISFYDQKRNEDDTTDIDLGLNAIIGGPIIPASDNTPEKIDVPTASSKTVNTTTSSFDDPFVFDFENNITSNQYRIMYDVVQDPNNPETYVLRPSTNSNLTNLVPANFPEDDLSLDALLRIVKPCYVQLKDCLVKHPKKNKFDNLNFWPADLSSNEVPEAPQAPPQKPAGKKRSRKKSQLRVQAIKPKNTQLKIEPIKSKKTKATKKSRKRDLIQKKREIVISPPSPIRPPEIETKITNLTRPVNETRTLPLANQPLTIERKNVLINDWLQEASTSQATQPDKYMDVNELLQDANLFISSDIEDDAFQLAKYMECNDQTNNYSQTSNSINPTSSNTPQQPNLRKPVNYSRKPWNAALKSGNSFEEPLDLSMKQTTPMSTDTGFGNDSFLLDVTPCESSNEVGQAHSTVDVDNSNNAGHGIINHVNSKMCTEDLETSQHDKNQKERNCNLVGDSLKQSVPQTNILPSTCESKPATATKRKRKLSIDKTALRKKKTRPTAEQKPAFTSKKDTPEGKVSFTPRPPSTNETKENTGYSTDLDYEPSEDEDVKENDKVKTLNVKIKRLDTMDQKLTFPSGNNNSKKWDRLVIKIPNNTASSSRVVVVDESSPSKKVSKAKVNTKVAPTPVNIVEPLPPVTLPKKPKPVSTIAPVQIIRNLHYGMMVPPGPNDTLKRQMMFVFNWPCLKYLNGTDCGVMCTFNHDLPPPREIFEKAILFSNDTIMYMYYNFIAKSNITFNSYFEMISEIFGSRKMETSLINAIKDCEKRERISFLKYIYRGLEMTGLSKREALTKIAESSLKTRTFYDIILEIMIETDALYFIDMLKQYYRHGIINSTYMLKLLQQVLDNPAPSLVTVFVDILDKYSNSDVCDVGTFKLIILKATFLIIGDINLTRRWNIIESRIK